MRVWIAIAVVAAGLLASAPASAQALSAKTINDAQWAPVSQAKLSAAVFKAQVLLARAGFSPGVIDARGGENFGKALKAFQQRNGLPESGLLDQATWDKLTAGAAEPVAVEYEITRADVKGPFVKRIASDFEKMAELERLAYRGPRELLAEKFHMDEDLLAALNPRRRLERAGTTITVAAVGRPQPQKAARVEVAKGERAVRAYAADGALIAYYPASIGSGEKPAPSGAHAVRAIAPNPVYHYNPDFAFKGVKAKEKLEIAPGPNNPVGTVWIDLTVDSYGIHGTPEPDKVSKTYSHGCVRLTNWDAEALAKMVRKGTPVEFLD